MKNNKDIPLYDLTKFRHVHREQTDSRFGYDNLDAAYHVPGFELYSSKGLVGSVGPLKSDFYRMSITCRGTLDMQIGLEHYQHQPGTVSFTHPQQLFAKNNISKDAFGYYMLFSRDFLNDLVPPVKFGEEFPFYSLSGLPVFVLAQEELTKVIELVKQIDQELRRTQIEKIKAVQMYLYLILLEAKRSYQWQQLHLTIAENDSNRLVAGFTRLVGHHYLSLRQVADYADLLSVTPNYLNRVVKTITGKTASDTIKDMLLLEAKSQLRYTEQTVAEIAYGLSFSDPASFNRFFKASSGETPVNYRNKAN
ncbi:helix-turn-helix domain-containing protein [Mucilaginibacter sp. HD30]